jgi:hypothetical protein
MARRTKDIPPTTMVSSRRVAKSFDGAASGRRGTRRFESAQIMGHGADTLTSGEAGHRRWCRIQAVEKRN